MGATQEVTRDHLLALAAKADITHGDAVMLMEQVLKTVPSWSRLAHKYPIRKETIQDIAARVSANAARCRMISPTPTDPDRFKGPGES